MELDTSKRYLLSRPRGGFNDTMVQIAKSRLYAAKYDRILVLDMSRSGFRGPLTELFRFRDDFGCEVIEWNDDMAPAFDAATSVLPRVVQHKISSYKVKWVKKRGAEGNHFDGEKVSFDHARDHDAQVLVHEQAGGGFASLTALRAMTLTPETANAIGRRLQKLGRGYDAVHIRHSDYKTNFNAFLRRLRPSLKGRRVLVCSDSHAAKKAAETILHPSTEVLSLSDIPDHGGIPLHSPKIEHYSSARVDLLCDLFGLALADRLMFTKLKGRKRHQVQYSGFSLMADSFRRNPDWIKNMFSLADPALFEDLFPAQAPAQEQPSLMRQLYLWDQWRWNYGAKRKAAIRAKEIVDHNPSPENVSP